MNVSTCVSFPFVISTVRFQERFGKIESSSRWLYRTRSIVQSLDALLRPLSKKTNGIFSREVDPKVRAQARGDDVQRPSAQQPDLIVSECSIHTISSADPRDTASKHPESRRLCDSQNKKKRCVATTAKAKSRQTRPPIRAFLSRPKWKETKNVAERARVLDVLCASLERQSREPRGTVAARRTISAPSARARGEIQTQHPRVIIARPHAFLFFSKGRRRVRARAREREESERERESLSFCRGAFPPHPPVRRSRF